MKAWQKRIAGALKLERGSRGQGLTEFALILPLLLVVIMGVIDFGRALFIYTSIFNAAREGVRYGAVEPLSLEDITSQVRASILMADPAEVEVWVWYDRGPGTDPFYDPAAVQIGDRVVVHANHQIGLITPLISAMVNSLPVDVQAARTIVSLGEGGMPGAPSPAPPTATPEGGPTATATVTATTEATSTPVPTQTPVPTVVPTSTPLPPIVITEPLWENDRQVIGTAAPGAVLSLRDVHDASIQLSTTVGPDGVFSFNTPPLVAGHLIVVQGYGEQDFAVVQGTNPTATPTPVPTPTPTPPPDTPYIVISPECAPDGEAVEITVEGFNWTSTGGGKKVSIDWDGGRMLAGINPVGGHFQTSFTVTPAAGEHTVTAINGDGDTATAVFVAPCVPDLPNLRGGSLELYEEQLVADDGSLRVVVEVLNVGTEPVGSFFWVDMYLDPASPDDLQSESSVAWGVVSSLAAGESVTMVLSYDGFVEDGDHTLYVLADTWDQVIEADETDNVVSMDINVSNGILPTPTPTPSGDVGSISGETWLFIDGYTISQGRVDVYAYDALTGALVGQTVSDADGAYLLSNLPPGSYDVVGELTINGQLYKDTSSGISVIAGQTVEDVLLVLH